MSETTKTAPTDLLIARFVDLSELLGRVENDRELLAELFAMFQQEFPILQDELHDAMRMKNLLRIATAAHTLKGLLANLSMRHCAKLAASIEAAARSEDIPAIYVTLAAFDLEIAALPSAVSAFISGQQECRF